MLRMLRKWLVLAAVAVVGTIAQGYAQTATITGAVTDPMGSVFVQLSPSNQNRNTGSTRERPNIAFVADAKVTVTKVQPIIRNSSDKTIYLDPAAFSVQVRGTFGTAPRNYFNGPGTNNWDLMLGENYRRERFAAQFPSSVAAVCDRRQSCGVRHCRRS
jgi:hypothetical protein